MLDCSPAKLLTYREQYARDFWQLRTPLTKYARASGIPYGLDNGCYKQFEPVIWNRLLNEAEEDRPVFATMPDIVGDALRTLELFEHFKLKANDLPLALVIQDGIERVRIPWDDIAAVFIGGSTQFKHSREALAVVKTARLLGKWVHIGRVNTCARARNWVGLADSVDGSGMSRFDDRLHEVLAEIDGTHPQYRLTEMGSA